MSFKISDGGRQFLSQLIEDQKSKVSGSTPCHTTEENQSDDSEPTPGIMCDVLGASAFLLPKPRSAPLTANGRLSPHVNNVNPPSVAR
jgi:hypothetical protein